MKKILLILLFCLPQLINAQGVVLNETMSSNLKTIFDEDGDTPDWIELYNSDVNQIILDGYYLSDDSLDIKKWQFESAVINPGEHLLVFASDKDIRSKLNHWETIINQGDKWKYQIGSASIPVEWIDSTFNDDSWSEGISGFGYNDNDDNTDLQAQSPFISLLIRKDFIIKDLSQILTGVLHVDYDDGFVAYVNGTEVARSYLGTVNVRPAWDELASNHEAVMYTGGNPERFEIKNINNILVAGKNTIAIEVHNASTTSSDMTLIPFLSLGMKVAPDSASGSPGILDLDVDDSYYHTNFKINASGEEIILSNPDGVIIDQVEVPESLSDVSYARINDGELPWKFQLPTPGAINTGSEFLGIADTVIFSIPGGFYSSAISAELTAGESRIFYTLDGSDPDESSTEYLTPLSISNTTVVKAVSYKENFLPGPVQHHTYFINENTDLPVISLTTDPYNLFDADYGIYTNFTMDWERPAHVEFFEDDKSPGFSENCGIEIHGSQSANWDQKSISVKFKNRYGTSKIEYPLFPGFDLTTFKAFVLRNSGNDWQYTHIRDAVMQMLVKDLEIDYQEYRPATTFINGEYWGIYNIREKINEHYVANRHGVDPDNIDMLENNMDVIHGDSLGYQNLIDYMVTNDMTTEAAYAYLDSAIDLNECILYFAAQAYYDNMDWPGTNIKFWRERSDAGKWRWILFGLDFGFGLYGHGPWEDHIEFMFSEVETRYSNPPWATLFQRKLIENPTIRNRFINQVADLLNTNFKTDRVVGVINTLGNHISGEITRHRTRWGLSGENLDKLINFAQERPAYLRTHVRNYFNCGEDGSVRIDASAGGSVQLNTLNLHPADMPFYGIYFQENEVHMTAIPASGYKFDGWSGSVTSNEASIKLSGIRSISVNASFSIDSSSAKKIVINEINYNSADDFDSGDWIELYNSSDQIVNISGWVFSDSVEIHQFNFPEGTVIDPDEYLVVIDNDSAFTSRFPNVKNYVGETGFGLSGSGELISLADENGRMIDSLVYDDNLPWPVEADGLGATIELIDAESDNAQGKNWKPSNDHGTPGSKNSVLTAVEESDLSIVPRENSLSQNYPNPFNPTTAIGYRLSDVSEVELSVYNLAGQKIATLFSGKQSAGYHHVEWDASGFASGIYFYRLQTDGGFVQTRKLMLIK